MPSSTKKLRELSTLVRSLILRSTTAAGSGHPSSSLSATDLMTTLMFGGFFHAHLNEPGHPNNDRLIFSKGHAAPLFYALYAAAHQISDEQLMQLRTFNSPLEGHPTMRFPFTEAATGSLGQGLAVGVGFALNAKYVDHVSYKTFVLLGDSEMAEGSVWETAQLAAFYKLNNLIGILDVNGLGQRGKTMYGHDTKAYASRLKAFGWKTIVVDGHNLSSIAKAYSLALREKQKPVMIIARTVKGKGVKFIENKEGWHGRALTGEECKQALAGLPAFNRTASGVVFPPKNEKPEEYQGELHLVQPQYAAGEKVATRQAYGEALAAIFPRHRTIVALDAEVSNSTGADVFKRAYPDRFFEMFIAEQNMVGTALGFSRRGKIPFVSTFAAFFTRAADQIRMSQYSDANVKFVGSHVGVSIGQDGVSQMGLEDIALFRSVRESVVLYPSDAIAAQKLVEAAAEHVGLVYLRTTREKTAVLYDKNEQFPIGGSKVLRRSSSDVATVVAAGITVYEALKAYETLQKEGINTRVVDLYSVKPIDLVTLRTAAHETGAIVTVEDHYEAGGIGEAVAGALSEWGVPVHRLCVRKMPRSGKPEELLAFEEIDAAAIVKKVKNIVAHKTSLQIS